MSIYGAVAAALTMLSAPASAQDRSGPEWVQCVVEEGGDDLPGVVLDDFLASSNVGPEPAEAFAPRLNRALATCSSSLGWSEEQWQQGFTYALHTMLAREGRQRLTQMGVSDIFISEMIDVIRDTRNGIDRDAEGNAAFSRELARGQLGDVDQEVLAHIIVSYVTWVIDTEDGNYP